METLSGFAPAGAGWVSCSHAAIAPFRLHRPQTAAQAASLVAERGAAPMAGGIDLIARLRDGRAVPEVVWLGDIAELKAIRRDGDTLSIGAGITHYQIETDPSIGETRPDIAAAWRTIGNIRVRMAGTVGGNLLAGNAQYDGPVILAAAGARLVFAAADGEAIIDLAATPDAPLPDKAVLARVELPLDGSRTVMFDRSLKPAVSVALGLSRDPGGALAARIAVGCAYPRPVTVTLPDAAAVEGALGTLPPAIDDAIASAGYRTRMVGVLVRRLIDRAGSEWETGS